MAENPETIKTFVKVPDDAIIVEVVEVVSYIDKDGDRCWSFRMDGETPVSSTVGLLYMVAHRILAKYVGYGPSNS